MNFRSLTKKGAFMETEKTILVVDDDDFTGELTTMILEDAGYTTIFAVGGPDALDKLAANPQVGLIVSDMNMPFMNGVQLLAEVRGEGCRQPFVLLTGEDAVPIRQAHPEMDAVLTKDEKLQETLPEAVASLLK
jgi:two-component system chemotaxis response regulator CheY